MGFYSAQLNLGFSRLFGFRFLVSDCIDYGILGADFLSHHHLCVDLACQRLTENFELERCSRELPAPTSEFEPSYNTTTRNQLLTTFKLEFPEVFNANKRSRFTKHSVVADIETFTETPITLPTRRLSPDQFHALKTEIKRLNDHGIIERSQSPWAFPIVMVKKKSGDWRLCADLTRLNSILKTHKYALPNIRDFSFLAHGCKWFSCLDIADAYYNIPVNPAHKHKLTITTPLGNYCYNYLPMGLASSSCYYQRLMNEVISGLPQVFCYLDDIIVMSKTYDEHIVLLRQVFNRLSDHGLIVKESKCILASETLSFLGYSVSSSGLSPLPSKVSAIQDFQLPRTTRQLKTFLGMYQFYAHFVPNYSEWLQPLHDLATKTSPRSPISWTDDLVSCFRESKDALAKATLLAFPDPDAETELITDASGTTVGCVLQQVKDGVSTPLGFWSKGLTKSQMHWSTFEKELFACYASLKHFRYFLEAKDFTLLTDHRPIVSKFYGSTRAASPRQERFFDFISQMTNKIKHVEGSNNVADLFSRPIEPEINSILPRPNGIDYLEMAHQQRLDAPLQQLVIDNTTSLILKHVPLGETGVTLLCDDSQGRLRPVVPSSMRHFVFRHFHSLAHPGVRPGTNIIRQLVVWPGMRADISKWTKECQQCARSKVTRHNVAPLSFVSPPPRGRFNHVYVDLTGPLCTSQGYNYIMVVVDRFSRFFQAIPLVGITAEECIDAFIRHWVALFGCPEHIFCDRGSQFTSSGWSEMCNYLGCQIHHSTAYHPQAQGTVERLNRTLKTSLKCQENPSEWFNQLPWAVLALRNLPKEDLGFASPSEIVLGQPVRLPGEFFENTPINTNQSTNINIFANNFAKYISNIPFSPARTSHRSSHLDPHLLNPQTTHVYIRVDRYRPPLHPAYKGPYKIVQRHRKYFEIDFRTHIENVSIDRLKTAHLSISGLNHIARLAPQTPTPPTLPDIANTCPTAPLRTRRGRIIQPPCGLRDYELY